MGWEEVWPVEYYPPEWQRSSTGRLICYMVAVWWANLARVTCISLNSLPYVFLVKTGYKRHPCLRFEGWKWSSIHCVLKIQEVGLLMLMLVQPLGLGHCWAHNSSTFPLDPRTASLTPVPGVSLAQWWRGHLILQNTHIIRVGDSENSHKFQPILVSSSLSTLSLTL